MLSDDVGVPPMPRWRIMSQMSQPLARMSSMMLQPESIELAFNHFRDVSVPLVVGQEGAIGIIGAGNRETGFGCAISFWESMEGLERSNGNPQVVEAMAGYAKWMAGPFKVESFTVASGAVPEIGPDNLAGSWMRMTTIMPPTDQMDAVLAVYAGRLASVESSSPACFATLLLAPQIGPHILALELWSSRTALSAHDAAARLDDQRLFRERRVAEAPVRDTLEVFGIY